MLPKISVMITANTEGAEAGIDRTEQGLNRLGGAADRAGNRVTSMGRRVAASVTPTRNYGFAVQNASFQAADFAVQVQGGVDASRALAQQLPQLLGGFGILGAVLGAVVAIGIPLGSAFQNMAENGNDVSNMLGVLQPAFERMGDVMRSVASAAVTFADVVVNNLDRIIITAGVAAAAFGAKLVGGFIAARIATFSLSAAMVALRGALIRTGIGALIVAAGEMVYQFTRLVKAAGGFGEAMILLKNVALEVWIKIKAGASVMAANLGIIFNDIQFAWASIVGNMRIAWGEFIDSVAGTKIGEMMGLEGGNATAATQAMADSFGAITDNLVTLMGTADQAQAVLDAPMQSIQALRDAMSGLSDDRVSLSDLFSGSGGEGDEGGSGGGAGGRSSEQEKLDEELSAQEERVKTHFDRIKAMTTGGLSDKAGAWSDYFSNLASLTGSSNDKMLKASKAFGASMALIDAWQAHNQVLKDPAFIGRPWARAASALQVLGAGLGAVNAIKSGSSSASGSSGSSAQSQQAPTQSASPLEVNVTGLGMNDIIRGSDAIALFDMIREAGGDQGVIIGTQA